MSEEFDDLSVLDEIDIPEVMRDNTFDAEISSSNKNTNPWLIAGITAFIALTIGAIAGWQILLRRSVTPVANEETPVETETPEVEEPLTETPEVDEESLLGHFEYSEAPSWELVFVQNNGSHKLRPAAAGKYNEMASAAARDGINLFLISAFRSIEEQEYLFFDIKAQRAQSPSTRAEVSAPPGYSEHHTGYTVDIGDGNVPGTHLSESFENTAAFRWLEKNAPRFSFELSFPRDNPQDISYEPWHWRFVGDQNSLETFYKSRTFSDPDNTSTTP